MATARITPRKKSQKVKPHQKPNPPKQTAGGLIVHPEYFERIKGKIEDYLLAKADGRSEKPLQCPVCEGIKAFPGDRFGNLVPDCNPVGHAFTLEESFSGEQHAGGYPWAITHARHLATELSLFLETFRGVLVSHRDPLDFTPQEVLIRDALNHSRATSTLLDSLNEQYR